MPPERLESRYTVKRNNDTKGKHNSCWYFVLDPLHDPIAVEALHTYIKRLHCLGHDEFASDLMYKLEQVAALKVIKSRDIDPKEQHAPRS